MSETVSKVWSSLYKDMEILLPFQVSESDITAFRALSGDENPLHCDAAYAKAAGFEGPVVYGAFLAAIVSRLLGSHVPGPGCVWHSLSLRFIKPLYVKQPATLKGTITYCNVDQQLLRMAISIRTDHDLVADGNVQAGSIRKQSASNLQTPA